MSSHAHDLWGLQAEVATLRNAIAHLGGDVRAAERTLERRTPRRRQSLGGGEEADEQETPKDRAKNDAVDALAKALVSQIGAPAEGVSFGPPGGGLALRGSTSLLSPRGPAASALLAVFTHFMNKQKQNTPTAPAVAQGATPPVWSNTAPDANASAVNTTLTDQVTAALYDNNSEAVADILLNESSWATAPEPENSTKAQTMSVKELEQIMDDLLVQSAEATTFDVSQQQPAASAPVPPVLDTQPDAEDPSGWRTIISKALSYIQNNPLAQTVLLEIAKRARKEKENASRTSSAEPDAEPDADPAAQEPPQPNDDDDDDDDDEPEYQDAEEEPVHETTRVEKLLEIVAMASQNSPPSSPSSSDGEPGSAVPWPNPQRVLRGVALRRVASTVTTDDADSSPPSSPSAASSMASPISSTPGSAYASSVASVTPSLSFTQTVQDAAHEHAAAACGDTPEERAAVVERVIDLVKQSEPPIDTSDAQSELEDALKVACEDRARGILEEALLDARLLRDRVKQLALSFHTTSTL
jgi:hypothetical protein